VHACTYVHTNFIHTVLFVYTYRRKRQYKQQDLNQLLDHYQISSDDLIPLPRDERKSSATPSTSVSSSASVGSGTIVKGRSNRPQPTFPIFLPLEVFDNTEFDCRTPEEWVALGMGGCSVYTHGVCMGLCVCVCVCVSVVR